MILPDLTETDPASTETILDARGMKCPLPVLKAGKALRGLASGAAIRVLVTDPGAPKDFEHFCYTTGAKLVSLESLDDHTAITIRRA